MQKPPKCLTKGCPGKKIHGRGLCQNCYHTAFVMVQRGETTWDELVQKGVAKAVRAGSDAERFRLQLTQKRKRPATGCRDAGVSQTP